MLFFYLEYINPISLTCNMTLMEKEQLVEYYFGPILYNFTHTHIFSGPQLKLPHLFSDWNNIADMFMNKKI